MRYTALLACVGLVACRTSNRSTPAAERTLEVQTSDGSTLFVRILGSGPDTVLALHGGPGETSASLPLEPLAERHVVVRYDQRGNGRSSHVEDSTRLSIATHIADVDGVRRKLGMERVALLGHSWGADLATLYAAAYPQHVSRLLLVAPGPARQAPFSVAANTNRRAGFDSATIARIGVLAQAALADTAKNPAALCREFYGIYLRNYFVGAGGREKTVASICNYTGYSLTRANRVSRLTENTGFTDRMWDTLATKVQVPVLIVHGAQDFIPVASSEAWSAAFPNARLLVLDRSSHYPFVDREDVFFPAADAFLRGNWPDGAVDVKRR